ncbi:MAG: diguanylate cyclase [Pseudomonadota bacterium]
MSFRILFNLILAGCFGLFWLCSTLFFDYKINYLSTDAVSAEAKLHMQASLAIREYTQEHVKPYFDKRPELGFETISLPAFASMQTLDLLYRHYPGYRYREAVLNPTNAKNLAQPWEQTLITRYQQSPAGTDQVELLPSEDGLSLHAVKPIRITNATCLMCHGRPQDAPPNVRAHYPGLGGFGWKMNEVVGAQIVTVPKQDHLARFQSVRQSFNLAFLVIFGSLFVLLNVLLNRFVLNPLQSNNSALSSMAATDALTGVANRRAFDHGLTREIERARASGQPLSIVLLDIDHFKRVNDTLGHGVGDDVLRQLARELARKFRSNDLFARLGGEEFIAMLPAVALADAQHRAQVLCDLCATLDFGLGRPLTISIGVAQWNGTETANELVARCDAALYRAKDLGRDRVEIAS